LRLLGAEVWLVVVSEAPVEIEPALEFCDRDDADASDLGGAHVGQHVATEDAFAQTAGRRGVLDAQRQCQLAPSETIAKLYRSRGSWTSQTVDL
jgi:hypothetical protein